MVPGENRLRTGRAFRAVMRSGRRAGATTMTAHLLAEHPSGTAVPVDIRIGFVVGRAVGDAVTRNRIRRRLRHVAREHISRLPPGSALVVRALEPATGASSRMLGDDLDACLRHLLGQSR